MKLLDYQHEPADKLEQLLRRRDISGCADFSDMGTGKTYVACEVMRRLDEPTLVVGPKISRSAWLDVGSRFGIEFDYCHYDLLRASKTKYCQWKTIGHANSKLAKRFGRYQWHPGIRRVIFDEAHRCSGVDSFQGRLLSSAVAAGLRPLVITATVADSPLQLKSMGYTLGLHDLNSFPAWARANGCSKGFGGALKFTDDPVRGLAIMENIRKQWADRVVRTRKADIPNFNAGAQLIFPLVDVPDPERIDELTATIRAALAEMEQRLIDRPVHEAHPMVRNLRARQEASLLMKPATIEMARDYIGQGCKVAFFENFKQSIAVLKEAFPDAPVIDGNASEEYRVAAMRAWNEDKLDAMILQEEAGGLSISLHGGDKPPVSLVEHNYNIRTLRQVYGRTDRAGGRQMATIVVPTAAGTIQEEVKKASERKGNNLDSLNDGELFACVYGSASPT